MADQTLNIFSLSDISTSDAAGFSNNGGYQFVLGTDTVTIAPGALSQAITIADATDATFDDDTGTAQVLATGISLNGLDYTAGTVIEQEYSLRVEDSSGTQYTLLFVSMAEDAYNIQGFVAQDVMPPTGEALTIIGHADNQAGLYPYANSAPSCFAAGTRIAIPGGWAEVRHLRPGQAICLAGGGTAPVRLVLHSSADAGGNPARRPVRLRAGALGPGCPARDLVLSPQHRVWVDDIGALVPARALTCLPRIGPLRAAGRIDYVHIVLARHAVILAEGVPCESFWPGKMAMGAMTPAQRLRIRRAMGPVPCAAAPFLTMRTAQEALRAAWPRVSQADPAAVPRSAGHWHPPARSPVAS
ncbi:Hint domain-containing protein [Acidimangrovimonas sediminis]|uniref:Hint domain-containing protein n=1 Tax=Acidimangrovimonas sediminis TaxID=2056283 RepID=UPI000C803CD8|nr:Hint domain-containing protein [Acidimangrovimonas sediminis]